MPFRAGAGGGGYGVRFGTAGYPVDVAATELDGSSLRVARDDHRHKGAFPQLAQLPVFDVRTYGAVGDGVTDDTAEIQAAIDAAEAAGGGVVLLPEATFSITTVALKSGVRLRGVGWHSVLSPDGSATAITASAVTDVGVDHLKLLGSGGGDPSGVGSFVGGIRLRDTSRAVVRSVWVTNTPGAAIALQGCQDSEVEGCVITNSGRDGIYTTAWTNRSANLRIAGNRINRVGDDAIAVAANVGGGPGGAGRTRNVAVVGNTIIGQTAVFPNGAGRGVMVQGAEGVAIVGNTIRDTFAPGVFIEDEPTTGTSCVAVEVVGNTIVGAGAMGDGSQPRSGIYVTDSAEQIAIVGNTIRSSVGYGVQLVNTAEVTVAENSIRDAGAGTNGVLFGVNVAGSTRVHIVANHVIGSAGAGIRIYTGSSLVAVLGNTLGGNGVAASATGQNAAGLLIEVGSATNDIVADGNVGYDAGGTPTQSYGLWVVSGRVHLGSNSAFGNAVGDYFIAGGALVDLRPVRLPGGLEIDGALDHDGTTAGFGGAAPTAIPKAGTYDLHQLLIDLGFKSAGSAVIGSLSDPTSAQQAATKAYVDAVASGLDVKDSVRVATTANVDLATGGLLTVDGVVLVAGDRVLVKDQTAPAENGIYEAGAGAWSRASDFDTNAEVTGGAFTFVEEGTTHADSGWVLTTNAPVVLGTTALAFAQFSGAGQITAGAGMTKTGNTLDVGQGSGVVVGADTVAADYGVVNDHQWGDVAVDGAATALARSDHNHGLPFPRAKVRRASGSNLAETFGATNGGAAPGTSKLSVAAAAGARLVAFQVRVRVKGTINTNAHATIRAVTAAPVNRDSAEASAGATDQFLNLGSIRTQAGDLFATPAWNATETSGTFNLAALLTDADEVTKIEVFVRRSNTTDAVEWEAQIVAAELG